ncbi:hypothetical protein PMAYCL1PPCAC_11300 [Pristionchus mayeri]|uniref:Anmt-1 n=1 Tax=Pristionchus mayeri TaxID=1317129 RepID=A0AAN5CDH3_9BILA|nr:hypothetical protein PMAYCL1PPCAC_11300 [Pristionchus mayeri]
MGHDHESEQQRQQQQQPQQPQPQPQAENGQEKEKSPKPEENCSASDHFTKFNPEKYLQSFYKTAGEDLAMQVVLFFLPGILYRLPKRIETMLDLGAGPTVYLPIACRDRVETIFTSDYAPANRQSLQQWCEKRHSFDWTKVCTWISNIEASHETAEVMQQKARDKVRAILDVNVHECPVVRNVDWKKDETVEVPEQFDLVTTVFCLEYSGETLQEYLRAVKGACSLVKPGGYLMQGGVLDADSYNFDGKRFRSHRLEREHVTLGLKEAGMCTDVTRGENDFRYICHDDIFIMISKKPETTSQ